MTNLQQLMSFTLKSTSQTDHKGVYDISTVFELLINSMYISIFRLQCLVDDLTSKFIAANLMLKQYDRVKLHATVMNTLFRKEPDQPSSQQDANRQKHAKDRESFDARNVLQVRIETRFC